jgi:hypothetical protein
MDKKSLIIGTILGICLPLLGIFIFLKIYTSYNLFRDFYLLKLQGNLGKIITLGAILNLALFFILLQMKKELMARGVVLATILLAIVTMFL